MRYRNLSELPPDTRPIITPEEERAILAATSQALEPQPSFLRRNFVPIVIGGGSVFLGVIGLFLFVTT